MSRSSDAAVLLAPKVRPEIARGGARLSERNPWSRSDVHCSSEGATRYRNRPSGRSFGATANRTWFSRGCARKASLYPWLFPVAPLGPKCLGRPHSKDWVGTAHHEPSGGRCPPYRTDPLQDIRNCSGGSLHLNRRSGRGFARPDTDHICTRCRASTTRPDLQKSCKESREHFLGLTERLGWPGPRR